MRRDEGWRTMDNLPGPLPQATFEDVKAVLEGLEPGVYLARTLYERHSQLKRAAGKEPATTQAFGRMLTEFGLIKRQRQGQRAWLVQ